MHHWRKRMKHGQYWLLIVAIVLTTHDLGAGSEPQKPPPKETPKTLRATVRIVRKSEDKPIAEIVLKGKVVITIEAWAGGQSPQVRAERVAQRLNEALELGATHYTFKIEAPHFEDAIVAFGRIIITSTLEDQWGTGISRQSLIQRWHRSLIAVLRQEEPKSQSDIVLVDEHVKTNVPIAFDVPPPTPSNNGKASAPPRAKPKPPATRAAKKTTKKRK
jgi:hypothetical protein